MQEVNKLRVLYQDRLVGTIVKYDKYRTAFAYDKEWLANGFAISPYSLPLSEKLFIAKLEPLDGVSGAFADSLPDGWGRLLVDRMLLKHKLSPQSIDNLQRLAIVGNAGMGALTYSFSLGGEHATTINGNGRDPGMQDLLEVGRQFGMSAGSAKTIAREIQECVQEYLGAKYINNKG